MCIVEYVLHCRAQQMLFDLHWLLNNESKIDYTGGFRDCNVIVSVVCDNNIRLVNPLRVAE